MKSPVQSLGQDHVARCTASLNDKAFGSKRRPGPVDLLSLAEAANVKWLQFRPLPIEGGLTPTVGGFDICINHLEMTRRARPLDHLRVELTKRQRFTLAHEIAHTFFYELVTNDETLPQQLEGTPVAHRVEDFCNYGAREILMPMSQLSRELEQSEDLIGMATAERVANLFKVSIEVCIRRLNDYAANRSLDSAILMVKEGSSSAEALILAAMTSPSILKYVHKRPIPHDKLAAWGAGFLPQRFWFANYPEIKTRRGVTLRRFRSPNLPNVLFIEVRDLLAAI
jgi:hypothetical protein